MITIFKRVHRLKAIHPKIKCGITTTPHAVRTIVVKRADKRRVITFKRYLVQERTTYFDGEGITVDMREIEIFNNFREIIKNMKKCK